MQFLYNVVLLLHILAAIVGFGGMIAHSGYNFQAVKSPAGSASSIWNAMLKANNFAEYAIYALLPLGIVLVSLSGSDDVDPSVGFAAPWISASFVVWFAMVGVHHALVRKSEKALAELAGGLDSAAVIETNADAKALAGKVAMGEGITQLLLVVALVLMIWQPGGSGL